MRRTTSAYLELEAAMKNLAIIETGDYTEALARLTVYHAISCVSLTLGCKSREELMNKLTLIPVKLWREVLRLLEIERNVNEGFATLEDVREAVEIAAALYGALRHVPWK